tara:strand:- start:228 stop:533 length:306 start_codon:yes stop_codon:yes gene_type:complete
MPSQQDIALAMRLRALADALLVPVATLTGLEPELVQGFVEGTSTGAVAAGKAPKGRKRSAYARKYKAAFKRVAKNYKKKNGEWKKGGFKKAVKAAHKEAKK